MSAEPTVSIDIEAGAFLILMEYQLKFGERATAELLISLEPPPDNVLSIKQIKEAIGPQYFGRDGV